MKQHLRLASVLVVLLLTGGCSAFRASAGVGLGLGGSARVGPVDVGLLGGGALEFGNSYGVVGTQVTVEVGLGLGRVEAIATGGGKDGLLRLRVEGLLAGAAYPLLASYFPDESVSPEWTELKGFFFQRPFEIAVNVYALVVSVHLGLDPVGLWRDLASFLGSARGDEMTDPPAGALPEPVLPEDGLTEPPWNLVSAEEIARVESGTPVERDRARRRLVRLLEDPTTLLTVGEGRVEACVPLSRAVLALGFSDETREGIARIDASEVAFRFEQAVARHDAFAIEGLLARHPFAPGWPAAAWERVGLLVEQGDLDEATTALREILAAPVRDEAVSALARAQLPALERLLARGGAPPVTREAWSGSAVMDGYRVGASGRAVWALGPSGEVAWENPEALPADLYARKVVGAQAGVVVVEAMGKQRAWLVGLESSGRLRWRVPLPAAAAGSGPMDQVEALGAGRVFVARTDLVLAIDARSGRILWVHGHAPATAPGGQKRKLDKLVPMDWKPPVGAPPRRPDGPHGFVVRLAGRILVVSSGRGRRVERLDARTGASLVPEEGEPRLPREETRPPGD